MVETLLGLGLVVLGLVLAPAGAYIMYGVWGVGMLVGFLSGYQFGSTVKPIAQLGNNAFLQGIASGIIGASVVGLIITLALFIGLVALPFGAGFQYGKHLFGESVLTFGVAAVAVIAAILVFIVGLWVLSAIAGGVLVSAGIQMLFSVAEGPASPIASVADQVVSIGAPQLLVEFVRALGAVGQSSLLLGITAVVAIAGMAGHLFVLAKVEG